MVFVGVQKFALHKRYKIRGSSYSNEYSRMITVVMVAAPVNLHGKPRGWKRRVHTHIHIYTKSQRQSRRQSYFYRKALYILLTLILHWRVSLLFKFMSYFFYSLSLTSSEAAADATNYANSMSWCSVATKWMSRDEKMNDIENGYGGWWNICPPAPSSWSMWSW